MLTTGVDRRIDKDNVLIFYGFYCLANRIVIVEFYIIFDDQKMRISFT